MRANIVFTLTGTDRIGLVEEVTELLLDLDGNVETSRMARLGGEFAMLMLVSLPAEQLAQLDERVKSLTAEGFKVTTTQTAPVAVPVQSGWQGYQIDVLGADHEGIVHEIAAFLADRGINIESMETGTSKAPMSASPLFSMTAVIAVPPSVAGEDWQEALDTVGDRLGVDVKVTPAEKP